MAAEVITKDIKDRLAAYTAMLRRIDNQIERLERMEATMISPKAQRLDGMPRGGSGSGDRIADMLGRKEELEHKIREDIAEERAEYQILENMAEALPKPDETAVIQLRYFDRLSWPEVAETLFGSEPDYAEDSDVYMRRTLRIHGAALLGLAKMNIYNGPGA